MKGIKTYIIIVVLLNLTVNKVFSQEGQFIEVRDLETWSSAGLKFKLDKNWSFGLDQQIRSDNNSTDIKNLLTEFNTSYRLNKNIEFSAGLRYSNKNDNQGEQQGYEHYFRYNLDASFKHELKRFDFKYRLRYSNKNEIGISKTEGDFPEQYFRFKTSIAYNIKNWKLDPEFSGEIFNKYVKNGLSNGFDIYRLSIGSSYKIKNYGKIGVNYILQKEISSFYPKTSNIIRLKYTYTFKK